MPLRPSNGRESWWPPRQLRLGALEVEQAQEVGGETLAAGRATTGGLALELDLNVFQIKIQIQTWSLNLNGIQLNLITSV
jgi:hypothetical protein